MQGQELNSAELQLRIFCVSPPCSVIPDTLSASMAPQALTLMEGDALELTCEVSKSTAQHTHLSVGWYLQGAGEHGPKEILTLSKDFILKPGPSYEQRFLEGDVQLTKVGSTTYKLIIRGVKPSDQGQLYCEAAEWIEDPDQTWKDISRKEAERTSLAVVSQGKAFANSCVGSSSPVHSGLYSSPGTPWWVWLDTEGLGWAQGRGSPWFRSCWCFGCSHSDASREPTASQTRVGCYRSECPEQPGSLAALNSSVVALPRGSRGLKMCTPISCSSLCPRHGGTRGWSVCAARLLLGCLVCPCCHQPAGSRAT